ncbi:protein of unknown function (plasmid) [Cupriavidus taiwanensis]|nr:protein of unknown function [Cupriavidus taiwanensis]
MLRRPDPGLEIQWSTRHSLRSHCFAVQHDYIAMPAGITFAQGNALRICGLSQPGLQSKKDMTSTKENIPWRFWNAQRGTTLPAQRTGRRRTSPSPTFSRRSWQGTGRAHGSLGNL